MVPQPVELVLDPRLKIFTPETVAGEDAASVCPAVAVDYPGLHEYLFPGQSVGPYGVVRAVYLTQSSDLERNTRSSSGAAKEAMARSAS